MLQIEIDSGSGFCFGVTTAIRKAEEELAEGKTLYCLGDIVHNGMECERLRRMGLITINHDELRRLHDVKVLLRAHGEPPETYELARRNNIEIIDATCPVVLQLQRRIKKQYEESFCGEDFRGVRSEDFRGVRSEERGVRNASGAESGAADISSSALLPPPSSKSSKSQKDASGAADISSSALLSPPSSKSSKSQKDASSAADISPSPLPAPPSTPPPNSQIVIFGKKGHAEVLGLVGQTESHAIVIEQLEDAAKLDFDRDIYLYSQTTKSLDEFHRIIDYLKSHISPTATFRSFDTICRQVANRMPNISTFATRHDLILFVCGRKSSNGKVLFNECRRVNPNSHLIEGPEEIQPEWLADVTTVGICGATSTPKWLMERCRDAIEQRMEK